MISCGDAQEFVPFGREYLRHHPGEVGLPPPRPSSLAPHLDLLRQLDTVSINGSKVSLGKCLYNIFLWLISRVHWRQNFFYYSTVLRNCVVHLYTVLELNLVVVRLVYL